MLSDDDFIFEVRNDEVHFKQNEEIIANRDEVFEIEQLEEGVERITIQNKLFKNLEDTMITVNNEISAMYLEHHKENKIYELLKLISCEIEASLIGRLNEFLAAGPLNESVKKIVSENHEYVYKFINEFSTRAKRKTQMKKSLNYVQPEEKALGLKCIMKHSDYEMIQESFQYVSILNTLSAVFSDDSFLDMYIDYNTNNHKCEDGIYLDLCCGKRFKELSVFDAPTSIQIQMGIDDFEVCCPLKSKVKIHKMTGIYFQIRNLPEKYRSRLNNIYLVALCKTENVNHEKNDFEIIANLIVNELKALETDGIVVNKDLKMNGSLVHILADNLGANTVSGFVKGFNAHYSCRFCVCDIDDRQIYTSEFPDKIRTLNMYNTLIDKIMKHDISNPVTEFGIVKPCAFNELQYFHILQNWTVDLMHYVQEGVASYFLKHFIKYCNRINISEADIIRKIRDFDYGPLSKKNKPSLIVPTKTNLGQSAVQIYCLIYNLPFIMFEFHEKISDAWKALKSLLSIMQIVYSRKISEQDISKLTDL